MFKKILIITYYKSLNPGTYLQAYGVQVGLKKIYPNSQIQYLRSDEYRIQNIKKSIKFSYIQLFFTKLYSLIRKIRFRILHKKVFSETTLKFHCFEYDESEFASYLNGFDLVCIGSDTILEEVVQNNKIGFMWGNTEVKASQIFFAASGDDCSKNQGLDPFYPDLKEKISNFKFIGLRDDIIRNFFVNNVGISNTLITKQPDPTYLLPLSLFRLNKKNVNQIKRLGDKIALFHFDRRFLLRAELANTLKKEGYRLVTPEYDTSCDISLKYLDPYEWGDLFKYCDVVFTERFHDTVFALRHLKPAFTFDWDDSKINAEGTSKRSEILKTYNLTDHYIKVTNKEDLMLVPERIRKCLATFDSTKVLMKNNELIESSFNILEDIANCNK